MPAAAMSGPALVPPMLFADSSLLMQASVRIPASPGASRTISRPETPDLCPPLPRGEDGGEGGV